MRFRKIPSCFSLWDFNFCTWKRLGSPILGLRRISSSYIHPMHRKTYLNRNRSVRFDRFYSFPPYTSLKKKKMFESHLSFAMSHKLIFYQNFWHVSFPPLSSRWWSHNSMERKIYYMKDIKLRIISIHFPICRLWDLEKFPFFINYAIGLGSIPRSPSLDIYKQ